jgi:hypothetical protein
MLGGARCIVPTVLVVRGIRFVAVLGFLGLLAFVFGGRVFLVFLLTFFVRGLWD